MVVPERLAPRLLAIYNEEYALPLVYDGARAAVVGRVRTDDRYRILRSGQPVCDAAVEVITAGIEHKRPERPRPPRPPERALPEVRDHAALFRKLVGAANLGSRDPILRYYDTEVQARMVIRAGDADASVMAPIPGSKLGCAMAVAGNPWYVAADPYLGSQHAVYEALRNLAAVGARPLALTDCLNFGNPEDPEVFHDFTRSVRGLGDAARAFGPKGIAGPPVPYVSGNVSFYNESSTGRSIEPSPIVAALGSMDDYAVAITWGLKRAGSAIVLTGPRGDRTGASQLRHALTGETGGELPALDLERERIRLYAVMDEVRQGSVLACHDIARGGVALAAFEMALAGFSSQGLGVELRLDGLSPSAPEIRAFGESPGFLLEVPVEGVESLVARLRAAGLDTAVIGTTLSTPRFRMLDGSRTFLDDLMDGLARIHLDAIRSYVE